MPRVVRRDNSQPAHGGWFVYVLVGATLASLLGFLASPAGDRWASSAATQEPAPVREAKKPIRYEAVIDNWRRYQSARTAVVAMKER
jgi:hypothetical protein